MFTPPAKESPVGALNRKLDEIQSRYRLAHNAIERERRAAIKPSQLARDAEIQAIEEDARRRRSEVDAAYDATTAPIDDEVRDRHRALKAAMEAEIDATRKEWEETS